MTISKRTLEKWRREALFQDSALYEQQIVSVSSRNVKVWQERILKLTQVLLDNLLLEGNKK